MQLEFTTCYPVSNGRVLSCQYSFETDYKSSYTREKIDSEVVFNQWTELVLYMPAV